jgi:regulator of protease activity HflC (stomatin/prohibitin superfamily)
MGISSVLGFVALAGWVAVVAGIGLAVASASQNRPTRNGVMLAVIGVVAGVLFTVISQGVIVVQPQEVAVVFDTVRGELLEPRGPGISVVIPVIQEATIYSIAQREYTMSGAANEGAVQGNDAVVARTSDGQEVKIDATIIYSINPANVNLVHQRWENRFQNEMVRPTVRGIIRDEISRYRVEAVYSTQREALETGITSAIETRFEEEGLQVTDFLIRDIEFSAEYAQSIEQKQIAEQNSLRAEQEATRLRTQAEGERDAAITRAEGEAQSIRINAEAEADALALIREQIDQSPNLIEWRYVDTLSDNVSLMILPSNNPFLFDLSSLEAQAGVAAPTAEATPAPETESSN